MYADRIAAGKKRSIKERLCGREGPPDDDPLRDPSSSGCGKRQRRAEEKCSNNVHKDEDDKGFPTPKDKTNVRSLHSKLQSEGARPSVVKDLGRETIKQKLSGSPQHPWLKNNALPETKIIEEKARPLRKSEWTLTVQQLPMEDVHPHVQKASGAQAHKQNLTGSVHSQSTNKEITKSKSSQEKAMSIQKSEPSQKVSNIRSDQRCEHSLKSAGLVRKGEPSAEPTVGGTQKPIRSTPNKEPQEKSEWSIDTLLQSLGLEKYSLTFQSEEVDMAALLHMTDMDFKTLGIPMGPRKKILSALDCRT